MSLSALVLAAQLTTAHVANAVQINPFFPVEKITASKVMDNNREKSRWTSSPFDYALECREHISNGRQTAQFCYTKEGEMMRITGIKFEPAQSNGRDISSYLRSKTSVAVFYDRGSRGFDESDHARFFLFDRGNLVGDYTFGYDPGSKNQIQTWSLKCTLANQPKETYSDRDGFVVWLVKQRISSNLGGYDALEGAKTIAEDKIKGIHERLLERFEKRYKDDQKRYNIKDQAIVCK